MIIDTHSHLQFQAFKKDLQEVMERTIANDIWTINVGTKYETSLHALQLAEQYQEKVYAAVGLHPIYAAAEFLKTRTDPDEGNFFIKEQYFEKEKYKKLATSKKVVAIGEIGLDYYYKPKTNAKLQQFKEKQMQIFTEQLALAKELHLPLILHCRMAHEDLIKNLEPHAPVSGVVHCFTGSVAQMQQYLSLGLHIGINGIIFKLPLDEVVKECPLEKMLLETDCPYLTPLPEGSKRNEPLFIRHTVEKIAKIKNITFEEVISATVKNARALFKI